MVNWWFGLAVGDFWGYPGPVTIPFIRGSQISKPPGPKPPSQTIGLNNTASSRFLYATSNVSMTCLSCFWIEILANILKNAAWHGPFFPHLTRLLCWSETTPQIFQKTTSFFFFWLAPFHPSEKNKAPSLFTRGSAPARFAHGLWEKIMWPMPREALYLGRLVYWNWKRNVGHGDRWVF